MKPSFFSNNQATQAYGKKEKALAWSVHAFTASGIVAGFLAIVAISQGNWKEAMAWLFVAVVIDGIDGTFARKFKVKHVLPHFDGKTVDYVIDFATYAIIPTFFFYEAFYAESLIMEWMRLPCAAAILLVSSYYYGKTGMVSSDFHFVGFPVLWNVVVFFLFFVLNLSPWLNFWAIVIFCILHFVPIKYLYPSRSPKYQKLNILMTILAILAGATILFLYPQREWSLNVFCLLTLAYFGGMSIYVTYFYE